jgi:hypothetical protein
MTLAILRSSERLLAVGALEFALQRFEDASRQPSVDNRLAAAEMLYEAATNAMHFINEQRPPTEVVHQSREVTLNINLG